MSYSRHMTTTQPATAADLRPGDVVLVEDRAFGRTVTVEGVAALDEEGVLLVEGVPLYVDEDGYLPRGVLLLSARRP